MEIKKVLLIFKTHLDIGFTDFAGNVVSKYMESFIPNALNLAKKMREDGRGRFVWTVGAWLVDEYLHTHSDRENARMIEGINNGDISWHGLPFTTHTEIMSPELFRYALSISKNLDKRFGKKTVAAKMTDVPGHTKAMIPYFNEAGIEFLHIGVNPASAVPDVPPIFRWQSDDGGIINVMYQNEYGSCTEIGDTGTAVYFCFTGDNQGLPSDERFAEMQAELDGRFPGAEIIVSDLNGLAAEVKKIENTLPVITDEIGDTWIHGMGTDPRKISQFKALQRFYKELPDGADKFKTARGLIMIPEHTWGLNVHVNLGDHEHYKKSSFNEIRKIAPNFLKMEKSWQEQRAYITDAVDALSDENRHKAQAMLSEYKRPNGQKSFAPEYPAESELMLGKFTLRFNKQGEIVHLEKDSSVFADRKHRLLSLVYEQFSANEYKRFFTQYNRNDFVWAREDFTKPGIENGSKRYVRFEPETANVYPVNDGLLVRYAFPEEAHTEAGCPLLFDAIITAAENRLKIDLAWFSKPANRVAEGIWCGFRPIAANKRISKLGQLIDPSHVVKNGQCRLHATDFGAVYDELSVETLDTVLVAPQEPSLLNFCNIKPSDDDAVYFNLYNNVWGTNFPMWYDEDARFRFVLNFK